MEKWQAWTMKQLQTWTMGDQVVVVGPVEMGTTSAVLLAMTWSIDSP